MTAPHPRRRLLDDLGFTDQWIGLGLLTDDVVGALEVECGMVDDPNPNHYRWKVYMRHLHGLSQIGEQHARDLYEVAQSEPETPLAAAMIGALVRHPQCPRTVLELVSSLPTRHLAEAARQRLSKTP